MRHFYEFFAGGGMARAGLGPGWRCVLSNDIDRKKAAAYAANWGGEELRVCDVADLTLDDIPAAPRVADLAWASFPCQDLSLAGVGAGLNGARSGAFWPFWRLMESLRAQNRAPRLIVLENVRGVLSSHQGRDFAAIGDALAGAGYAFGALVIDAALFLPQSRPRLFIIGVCASLSPRKTVLQDGPDPVWHPERLVKAQAGLSAMGAKKWLWWRLPEPEPRASVFAELVEPAPKGVRWHKDEETAHLLGLMSELHRDKIRLAQRAGRPMVGAVYKRTRADAQGRKVVRAEARFDDVVGCLRTPAGGSSRQTLLFVDGERIRSRLLSPREAARLMGLPDAYILPERYNDAYHVAGDGVVAPVVRHLAKHILEPVLAGAKA
jgi:DNA (cytosine-5)-methyltransferase 1